MNHQRHRHAFTERLRDAAAVFFAAPETLRNNDVHHDFRQDSDFYYLTGFEEPESVLVIAPAREEGDRVVLFLRERDPEKEVWDGERLGTERAPEALGVDKAFPIEQLGEKLGEYLVGSRRLYHFLGRCDAHDQKVIAALAKARRERRKGKDSPGDLLDPEALLHEQRLIKSDVELEQIRAAAALTALGHRRAMASARPGLTEHQVATAMEYEWRVRGSVRNAYPSIVASGPNACILHYRAGPRVINDGELVLIDAGCELHYQATDVTRTWPVSGRFTEAQREIYELVLDAQRAAIALCKPGMAFTNVHDAAVRVLTEGMVRLGLLEGEVPELIKSEGFKKYYMHRTGHWIGMDVHDVGVYYFAGTSRALEPGMVLTVEPGLYIAPGDETAPERYRGIGVRIEDDVLVTHGEPEVLTAAIPKTVEEIEALVGQETLSV